MSLRAQSQEWKSTLNIRFLGGIFLELGESLRGNRIGATGLRASEKKSASERVSEREGFQRFLRGFERFSEVFESFFGRFSEIFERFSEVLSETF